MRILFGIHNLGQRKVAYWGINTTIASYGILDALELSADATVKAANMRTRPNPFTRDEINLLFRVGYAGADASMHARTFAKNEPFAKFYNLPFSELMRSAGPLGREHPTRSVPKPAVRADPVAPGAKCYRSSDSVP